MLDVTSKIITHNVGDAEWNAVYAALEPWFRGSADWLGKGRRANATNAVILALRSACSVPNEAPASGDDPLPD